MSKNNEQIMDGWTIFDHPSDFPDWFIARRWIAHKDGTTTHTQDIYRAKGLGELREILQSEHPHLVHLMRDPRDNPKIVEVWI